jgi:hypothetical protein
MDDRDLTARLDAYLARFATFAPAPNISRTQVDRAALSPRGLAAPRLRRRLTSVIVAAVVVSAMVLLLIGGLALRNRTQPLPQIPQTLFGGPAAKPVPNANHKFVWLTGMTVTRPTPPCGGCASTVTVRVDVIDWTGAVRYHFDLPRSTLPDTFNDVATVSADGTRALLTDGRVLDQTGRVIGDIRGLSSEGPGSSAARWLADDSGLCVATSNEPIAPTVPLPPKGATPTPTAPKPPYALPGAEHSVTLKVYMLDGQVRTVATVGSGSLGEPSGAEPDGTSVLSCDPGANIAVIARYHDAGNDFNLPVGATLGADTTVSLWAVRLSSGAVLFHTPETRIAEGRPFFFGSENGALAVEFLWNNKVLGSEIDTVLHMPSGRAVPVRDDEPIPDTPALSADGTRILRRFENAANTQTTIELIDAATGTIIRSVVIPMGVGATAVADPGGSSFLVDVEGQLALVDQYGGISRLATTGPLTGSNAVALPTRPGTQG